MTNVLKSNLNNDKHIQLIGLNGFQSIDDNFEKNFDDDDFDSSSVQNQYIKE
jgi:hypothetical protein